MESDNDFSMQLNLIRKIVFPKLFSLNAVLVIEKNFCNYSEHGIQTHEG